MLTDQELVAAFKNGEIEALGALMERHKAAVYGYLLRLTARPETADDIFQEVWLKLVRKPGAYSEKEKFKAWLFTVARNAAMDYFRRESARRAMFSAEGNAPYGDEDAAPEALETAASPEPGPHEVFENKALGEKIGRALMRLSADQREVFYLRHYSELSFKEIAEMLGLPIGTVLARMSRAAALLRGELEKSTQ